MTDQTPGAAPAPQSAQPAQQPPAISESDRKPKFVRLRVAFGMLPQPDGKPPYIWLERWDAFIVGVAVALGVPLLGLSGLSVETKKTILIWWLATWVVFFVYFEGRELIGQMMGRGAIKQEQLSEQQNTAQGPFYGVIGAFAIWALTFAIHVTIHVYPVYDGDILKLLFVTIPVEMGRGYLTTPVYFGFIEWFILVQVWVSTSLVNYIMYNTGNTFSKAAPMGERTERRG